MFDKELRIEAIRLAVAAHDKGAPAKAIVDMASAFASFLEGERAGSEQPPSTQHIGQEPRP